MFNNKQEFKMEFTRRLVENYGCEVKDTHMTEKYMALGNMVRDYASVNWKDTKSAASRQEAKQVYYFSMEFLMGRMLRTNLQNLGIFDMVVKGLEELDIDYYELEELEADPGLGNGGLGRLAACFMDSSASLNYPVNGNCIRYKYGLFKQVINEKGEQVEVPDMWLDIGNPWEIRKPKHQVDVMFGGHLNVTYDTRGDMHFQLLDATHIKAVPYDMPMIGANSAMTNTLRLWSAEPVEKYGGNLDFQTYLHKVEEICLNVYPDDSTEDGKKLRLKQQYFFVCAGINSIIRSHVRQYKTLDNLGQKVAIQLNDTHPVLAIPELMRVLMDDYRYQWDAAAKIVRETIAYTNHTVMSEALEKWPSHYLQELLPRIYMIIEEIDRRFCRQVMDKFPGDHDLVERVRIIKAGQVHMANLAIVGSHSLNGVAALHTEILKKDLFKDYYRLWPEKFSNKTNGITPRRWMLYNNPELAKLLDKRIGKSYRSNYRKFEKLMKFVDDKETQEAFLEVKRKRKEILAQYIKDNTGIEVDPDSIFDVQAKRLHAYKRQFLNILHVIYLYQRIKDDPNFKIYPHTYIFSAKAASAYVFAKKVIKLINNVADVINVDPDVKGMLKVVFLPNYCVSQAEVLVPGTDISEQISTAGKEASGTGNMKFMMNGAITLGTLDGANVEIDAAVGRENDVIFGKTVEELANLKWNYRSYDYYNSDTRIKRAMETLINGFWNGNENDFRVIYEEILPKNDEYFVLADFDAYVKAQEEISARYQDRSGWARSCLINIAKSGYFSSDRTIDEYAEEIWGVEALDLD